MFCPIVAPKAASSWRPDIFSAAGQAGGLVKRTPATKTPVQKTPARKIPAKKAPVKNTQGFPASLKLTRAADFKRVFKRGHRSSDECFVVLARSNQAGCARLGMAIARKDMPTAVARNRVKRLIRESFRKHHFALPAVDIVVMNRRSTAAASSASLRKSLDHHWNRIKKQ